MDPKAFAQQIGNLEKLGGHPKFYELLLQIAELHARKNHDYAKDGDPLSNFRRSSDFGISPFRAILVRMSDKWSRIEELSKKENQVKNESIIDSLMDNAVYSLLAIVLLEDEKKIGAPKRQDPPKKI